MSARVRQIALLIGALFVIAAGAVEFRRGSRNRFHGLCALGCVLCSLSTAVGVFGALS